MNNRPLNKDNPKNIKCEHYCKNVVDEFKKWGENTVRITYDYCYFCGQKLDWSE